MCGHAPAGEVQTFHALLSLFHLRTQILYYAVIIPELIVAQIFQLALDASDAPGVFAVIRQEPKTLLWKGITVRVGHKAGVVWNSCLVQS